MRRLNNIINFSFIEALVWGLIVYQKQSLGFNKSHRVSSISFSRAFKFFRFFFFFKCSYLILHCSAIFKWGFRICSFFTVGFFS